MLGKMISTVYILTHIYVIMYTYIQQFIVKENTSLKKHNKCTHHLKLEKKQTKYIAFLYDCPLSSSNTGQ
jgi:hypothetical protein